MHHELDDGPGSEELADFPAKGTAQEALEGHPLDVLAGIGEIVFFQLTDDFLTCRWL